MGPPKRPLCNGNIGANSSIGHIAFILLRPIRNDLARQVGTSVCSREELLGNVNRLNESLEQKLQELQPARPQRTCKRSTAQDLKGVTIGSMDVNSLYPSCLLKETTAHIKEALKSGCTKFIGMDKRFMLRYLALTVGKSGTSLDKFLP